MQMRKFLFLMLLIPLLSHAGIPGFAGPIKGIVKDETGQPLAGVTVTIKGSSRAARTDAEGRFTVEAAKGEVLVFSYVGHTSQEIAITDNGELAIELVNNNKNLNEVVVTALGIKRSEKSLTYSTQQIGGA